jgi:hypothetical protein
MTGRQRTGARRVAGTRAADADRAIGRRAAVVVAALAVFVAGVLVGLTLLGGGSDASPPAGVARRSAGSAPEGDSAAAPVARAQTREGAAVAAAVYLRALSRAALTGGDRARFDALIDRLALPARRAALRRELWAGVDASRRALAGTPRVLRPVPVGYRIERYSATRALVSVWTATLAASRRLTPGTTWHTTTLQLAWRGGWRLADASAEAGPSPLDPLEELTARAATFREYADGP